MKKLLFVLSMLLLSSGVLADDKANDKAKIPPPDAASLKSAAQKVGEAFSTDLMNARTPQKEDELAKKFLETALQTAHDPAGKFELLCNARDLAEKGEDVATAFSAIAELAQTWKIDALAMKVQAVAALAGAMQGTGQGLAQRMAQNAAQAGDQWAALIQKLDEVTRDAMEADRYDLARQCAGLGPAVASATGNAQFLAQANRRCADVNAVANAFDKVQTALARLAGDPADADANAAVGRFRCFMKGDWTAGLPILTHGNDASLRDLALKDLAGASTPDAQLKLGDAWWAAAEAETGIAKDHMQDRAKLWYAQAAPGLQGLIRVMVDSRLHSASGAATPATAQSAPRHVRGRIVATSIVIVADDFVTNVYLNGARIPDADIHLDGDIFGAAAIRVAAEIHAGDWLVFNVANNRFRWGGDCGFAAAGLAADAIVAFASNDTSDWCTCDSTDEATRFIQDADYLADHHAVVPKKPWPGCTQQMIKRCPKWNGKPIWGRDGSGIIWIKYVCR